MPEKRVRPFAPLDQYQPFVDEFGRVTPEWYSWLGLLLEGLLLYSSTFNDSTTVDVVFADMGLQNQVDTSYQILIESSIGPPISVTNKTTTGFKLSSSTAIKAVVKWMLVRS